MKYILFDRNSEMINAWNSFFSKIENVTVLTKDVAKISCDALVSPANSFGIMDVAINPEGNIWNNLH